MTIFLRGPWVLIALSLFTGASFAFAHPFDLGLLDVQTEGSKLSFRLEIDPRALAQISGTRGDALAGTEITAEQDRLLAATLMSAPILLVSGESCRWAEARAERSEEKVILRAESFCPGAPEEWSLALPWIARAPAGFEVVAKIRAGGEPWEAVANVEHPRLQITPTSGFSGMGFLQMGIRHIGAVPSEWWDGQSLHFPEGIDHILFVFALVLGGGGLLEILKTVTGFTMGHSATLALATLGWVHVPSRIVESAIALSIAIVAAESLWAGTRLRRRRWRIALAFGLIHGLGFASALADLHLIGPKLFGALVGFNIGVEAGQAVFVALLFPCFYALGRIPRIERVVTPALAVFIFLVGSYWFIQRAFGLGS